MRVAVRPRLPDFSVVVWLRKTNKFATLKAELLEAAAIEPYELTEYQGMVDFHWSAANLAEAKSFAQVLKGVAQHPQFVLLHIMSRVDDVASISISWTGMNGGHSRDANSRFVPSTWQNDRYNCKNIIIQSLVETINFGRTKPKPSMFSNRVGEWSAGGRPTMASTIR